MKSVKFATVLKLVGCVIIAVVIVFVVDRCFTVVRTLNSDKPMNESLLPETFRENAYRKSRLVSMNFLIKDVINLSEEIDDITKLFQNKYQHLQSQEVLRLKRDMDELSNEVDEMRESFQKIREQSQSPQKQTLEEMSLRLNTSLIKFSEIQARIQKFQNVETSAPPISP